MGSFSPPPGRKKGSVRPQPVRAAPQPPDPAPQPDVAPGQVGGGISIPPPLSASQMRSRLKIQEKKVPLGPKLSTIFGTIVLAGLVAYLVTKVPSRLASMHLQRYAGLDSPTVDWGNPRMCGGTTGCLAVYLSTNSESERAVPSCIKLADAVAERGIETVFVIGKDSVKECARMARMIRRPVLLDPQGEWAGRMNINEIPHFVVYTTTGEVKLRTNKAPAVSSVTGAFE